MITATITNTDITELSVIYDRIYDMADRLFKKYNPCNIHTENNRIFCWCYNEKVNNGKSKKSLCCSGCNEYRTGYWSENGCTVKCLACKLHTCYDMQLPKPFKNRLSKLCDITAKYGLSNCDFYMTKKEAIKKAVERLHYE